MGENPSTTLKDARDQAINTRVLLAQGVDPREQRAVARLKEKAAVIDTFKNVGLAWMQVRGAGWSESYRKKTETMLERHLFSSLGSLPITQITAPQLLAVLRPIEVNRRLRQLHPEIIGRTQQTIADMGGHVWHYPKTDLLTLNDELVISVVLARCHTLVDKYGQDQHRWHIRFNPARFNPDLTVAIRLDAANTSELDYYLLPRLDLPEQEIRVSNRNSAYFECFRFDNLDFFYGMSERERLHRFQHQ